MINEKLQREVTRELARRRGGKNLLELGYLLTKVRKELPAKSDFDAWVMTHMGTTRSAALNYIRFYAMLHNVPGASELSYSQATQICKLPKLEDRIAFVQNPKMYKWSLSQLRHKIDEFIAASKKNQKEKESNVYLKPPTIESVEKMREALKGLGVWSEKKQPKFILPCNDCQMAVVCRYKIEDANERGKLPDYFMVRCKYKDGAKCLEN